jgi:hypothetical protein
MTFRTLAVGGTGASGVDMRRADEATERPLIWNALAVDRATMRKTIAYSIFEDEKVLLSCETVPSEWRASIDCRDEPGENS